MRQQLLDNVLPDRAALDEALANREREVDELSAHIEVLNRRSQRRSTRTPSFKRSATR